MIEMKDSGVEWIGEIPKSWRTIEIKYYCENVYAGGTPQSSNMNYWNGNIPWIPSGSCHDCKIYSAPKTITKEGFQNSSTKLIPANTALVAMTGATCGSTGYLTFESCANQSVTAYIENSDRANSMYLWFLLQAAKQYLLTFQTGGAQGGVNVENCKNLIVPFIRLETQQRIANYLDRKCSKIDAIIEREQAVIEKLKEYKLSVITETITKGLDSNVEMKDSVVEWIDTMPKKWKAMKLKYCIYLRARLGWKGLKADEYVDTGYPLLSAYNIQNSRIQWENLNYISKIRYDESPEIKINSGDLLLVKDGAGIGKCAYISELLHESTTNGSLAVITSISDLNTQYLFYYFQSKVFQKYIDRLKDGMGVPHLFQSDLKEIKVPIPSQIEQREIASYLNKKVKKIDDIIEKKNYEITKLEKYKKSLIYEVVTGKKEV